MREQGNGKVPVTGHHAKRLPKAESRPRCGEQGPLVRARPRSSRLGAGDAPAPLFTPAERKRKGPRAVAGKELAPPTRPPSRPFRPRSPLFGVRALRFVNIDVSFPEHSRVRFPEHPARGKPRPATDYPFRRTRAHFRAVWRELPVITIAFPSGGLVIRISPPAVIPSPKAATVCEKPGPWYRKCLPLGSACAIRLSPTALATFVHATSRHAKRRRRKWKGLLKQTAHCINQSRIGCSKKCLN